jgi:uncharacterized membrane protein
VLLMIEVHMFDSWTETADRDTETFHDAMIVGGMGTALFLLLAGVAVALSAGSRVRRSGQQAAASNAVARRGLEIFALAFLFRLQAWILGWSSDPRDLLQVDILNIMGPSIVLTALLWRVAATVRGRATVFAVATVLTSFLTPSIRAMSLAGLPDSIAAYVVPVAGLSNFVFFPWMGLVFAGAFIGVLIDDARSPGRERALNLGLGVAGAAVAAASFAASFLPAERTHFWTTSPSFFFLRVGLMMVGVASAYAWTAALARPGRWSPMGQLGRTSLFIYWIHVEMLYGLISRPLHHNLSIEKVTAAYVLFAAFMVCCSMAKEQIAARVALLYSGAGAETITEGRRITS